MSIVLYVIASGFVMAGFLNAMHQFTHGVWGVIEVNNNVGNDFDDEESQNATAFSLRFDSPMQALWSVVMCILAGPYLVLIQSYRFWLSGQIPAPAFVICSFVAVVWSFCSGIFIVEAGLMLGIITQ